MSLPDSEADQLAELRERAESFEPSDEPQTTEEPDLEWAYAPLKNYTRMCVRGYAKLFMLDAAGGLGKTYNIKKVLRNELGEQGKGSGNVEEDTRGWIYKAGYTTPLALFESLWQARHGDVLFLDDMSGITSNSKCVEMLKAATDTEGEENWVTYESSSPPEVGPNGKQVQAFNFRGSLIMSFNDTPTDSKHFSALEDRAAGGSAYRLDFSYEDRLRLINEIAKASEISPLSYEMRMEMVEWLETVTDPSIEVSIRTLKSVLDIRQFAEESQDSVDWEHMCLEAFDLDYERYLIYKMRRDSEMSVMEQIETYKEKTGKSQGHYYNKMEEIKAKRNV